MRLLFLTALAPGLGGCLCISVLDPDPSLLDSGVDCDPEQLACDGECIDPETDPAHCGDCETACRGESSCDLGACVCPGALAYCADRCVDLQVDDAHCGECDASCAGDAFCEAEVCVCEGGLTSCAEGCVNIFADEENCGDCGNACEGELRCVTGVCR